MNKRAKQKAKENTIQRSRHRNRMPKINLKELFGIKDDIGREKTKEEIKEGK